MAVEIAAMSFVFEPNISFLAKSNFPYFGKIQVDCIKNKENACFIIIL